MTALSPSLLVRERDVFAPPVGGAEATDLGLKFSMICSVTRVVISTVDELISENAVLAVLTNKCR